MSVHDFYVLSPYLAMAGAAIFVILLDLVLPKKSLLPYFAFAALAGPFVMRLIQFYDLGGATNLLRGAEAFSTEDPSILLSAISVDRFALFFNFLIIGSVALVVLASTDYVRNMERFQGEYFGLILLAATGMMLLAAACVPPRAWSCETDGSSIPSSESASAPMKSAMRWTPK